MSKQIKLSETLPAQSGEAVARIRAAIGGLETAKPTEADRKAFHTVCDEFPELWRICGDLSKMAADRIINKVSEEDLVRESVRHGYEALMRDLGRDGASALERALIEQVGVCWLHVQYTNYYYTGGLLNGEQTINQALFWEKRTLAVHRRFERACETLARVRRLLLPQIKAGQVNIAGNGGQQVNAVLSSKAA